MRTIKIACFLFLALIAGSAQANFALFQAHRADILVVSITSYGGTCNGSADDSQAFTNFHTDAAVTSFVGTVYLDLPTNGTCCFKTQTDPPGSSVYIPRGISNLVVRGNGASFSLCGGTAGWFLGTKGCPPQDSTCIVKTQTATAGDSCVTLLTPAEASGFTVGTYTVMTAGETQGFGWPPNPFLFEYLKVSSANSSTGVVCFTTTLVNTYLSTLPQYTSATTGPAALIPLEPQWSASVEYQNLTIGDQGVFTFGEIYNLTLRNVTMTGVGNLCVIPSLNYQWSAISVTGSNCNVEADKIVQSVIIDGGSIHEFQFQSMSITNVLVRNGANVDIFNGSPANTSCDSSTIGNWGLGPTSYGAASSVAATNCTIPVLGISSPNIDVAPYTVSSGVILLSGAPGSGPFQWCVPGLKATFTGSMGYEAAFTMTGLTLSGGSSRCATSLSGNVFPTLPRQGGTTLFIRNDIAPTINFSGNIGSATAIDLSQAGARNQPIYAYTSRTYTCAAKKTGTQLDINSLPSDGPTLWGALDGSTHSITINVSTADTSATSPLTLNALGQFGSAYVDNAGAAQQLGETINLKVAGTRTINIAATSGAQSGDTLASPGNGSVFGEANISPFLGTAVPNVAGTCPVVTITAFTTR